MTERQPSAASTAMIVALGGFLMGFDASVISGVIGFIEVEFSLGKFELGWGVASLTLSASLAMMAAGPLSDRLGRKPVLKLAALLFAASAIGSALAPSFSALVIARIVGGAGVGMALIIAPMYIAELAPAAQRGRLVSFNQLNIVIGISAAFFSNYLILRLGQSTAPWVATLHLQEWSWRWMLGLETLPAVVYFFSLLSVPESPRWLAMRGRQTEALAVLQRIRTRVQADTDLAAICASLTTDAERSTAQPSFRSLFAKPMRLVLAIALTVAVLQQITGINAVFFYAPMIFEQAGLGKDAAFMQAALVGVTNLVLTIVALSLIDKVGRKPLLVFGVAGIAACMLLIGWSFDSAVFMLSSEALSSLPAAIDQQPLLHLVGVEFDSEASFRQALGSVPQFAAVADELVQAALRVNPTLILAGILGFVACFAISLGPIMWVLFSELFPNRIRALGISFVGLVNSAVSFMVQLMFPWQLANIGSATTFYLYGCFALVGLIIIAKLLPETRGKTLEELEQQLVAA